MDRYDETFEAFVLKIAIVNIHQSSASQKLSELLMNHYNTKTQWVVNESLQLNEYWIQPDNLWQCLICLKSVELHILKNKWFLLAAR